MDGYHTEATAGSGSPVLFTESPGTVTSDDPATTADHRTARAMTSGPASFQPTEADTLAVFKQLSDYCIRGISFDHGLDSKLRQYPGLISCADQKGNTLLHLACRYGLLQTAKIMLSHGADISSKTHQGHSPFDIARLSRQPALTKFLNRQQQIPQTQIQSKTCPVASPADHKALQSLQSRLSLDARSLESLDKGAFQHFNIPASKAIIEIVLKPDESIPARGCHPVVYLAVDRGRDDSLCLRAMFSPVRHVLGPSLALLQQTLQTQIQPKPCPVASPADHKALQSLQARLSLDAQSLDSLAKGAIQHFNIPALRAIIEIFLKPDESIPARGCHPVVYLAVDRGRDDSFCLQAVFDQFRHVQGAGLAVLREISGRSNLLEKPVVLRKCPASKLIITSHAPLISRYSGPKLASNIDQWLTATGCLPADTPKIIFSQCNAKENSPLALWQGMTYPDNAMTGFAEGFIHEMATLGRFPKVTVTQGKLFITQDGTELYATGKSKADSFVVSSWQAEPEEFSLASKSKMQMPLVNLTETNRRNWLVHEFKEASARASGHPVR